MTAPRTLSAPEGLATTGHAARTQSYTPVQEAALVVLRLVVAAVFLYAGTAKWPLWAAPMEGMSPLMHNLVRFLAIVEPLGAIALLLGLLTRWAAAGLGIIMVGAIPFSRITMHTRLFTAQQGTGLDYNFLILAGCLALLAFGAGRWSVDAVRGRRGRAAPPPTDTHTSASGRDPSG